MDNIHPHMHIHTHTHRDRGKQESKTRKRREEKKKVDVVDGMDDDDEDGWETVQRTERRTPGQMSLQVGLICIAPWTNKPTCGSNMYNPLED